MALIVSILAIVAIKARESEASLGSAGASTYFSSQDAESDDAAASAAKKLYSRKCQNCHGMDGSGAAGRKDAPEIPDFRNRSWQNSRSDAQLRVSIREGKGDQMPPFGTKLEDNQCRALVAFIRKFAPVRQPSQADSPGAFEQEFRRLQKEMEDLQEQYRAIEKKQTVPLPAAANRTG
jgi:mono/diheme cytochrome c family protein